jgi:hypothetical protein
MPGGTRIIEDYIWVSCGLGILYYSENKRQYGVALLNLISDGTDYVGKLMPPVGDPTGNLSSS